jgi:hypothetical protein
MAKAWKQKLEDSKEPKKQILEKAMAGVAAGGTLLLPTPKLLKDFIDTIPEGQQVTFQAMRQQIAQIHKSDLACPITTSMQTRVVAEAAWEDLQQGIAMSQVTPFWRVVEPDSSIAQKLACGADFIKAARQQEGIV